MVIMSPAEGDMKRDCWAVAFGNSYNDEERCVVSGYDNGDIKMFDLRTMKLRWETNVKNGVREELIFVYFFFFQTLPSLFLSFSFRFVG